MTPQQLATTVGSPAGHPKTDATGAPLSPDPTVVTRRAPAGSPEVWALIAAAQRGDREAFGQLYARYAGAVSRFVGSRVGGDRQLAQDLTSETFLRALRGIGSVSDRGRDPGAWFTTIARNLVFDHVKSSRYRLDRTTAEVGDTAAGQEGPEQAVIRKETVAELRRCVAALPRDQQECIRLRFLQELSVAETAAVIGRSDSAVKGLTHRGVQQLRQTLARNSTSPVPSARETVADPLAAARRAVAEVRKHREAADRQATDQDRAQQLGRWHTDDRAAECGQQREHTERCGELELTAEGGAA